MKKYTFALALVATTFFAQAQEVPQPSTEELAKQNWFHSSYAMDSIYGTASDAAYDYADAKGLKPSPVLVAVIDSGIDYEHEDLNAIMWVNKDEIPDNGIDDDKNGYIDDIHGWNFIGGPDGSHVDADNLEVTRLVREGMKLFETDDDQINEVNRTKYPEKYEAFKKMKIEVEEGLANAKAQLSRMDSEVSMVRSLFETFAKEYGYDKEISVEGLKNFETTDPYANQLKMSFSNAVNQPSASEIFGKTPQDLIDGIDEQIENDPGYKHYNNQLKQYDVNFDPRDIVGDDYKNKTEMYYGNNDVNGPDSFHGTHVAGIIGAINDNDLGIRGVARNVQIMAVRTVPNGDERDKDVANAIRYAVDNGAKILNMSFGKAYSPEKELVWDAIQYATDKGVLLVHAAGNDNKDIDSSSNYPTNYQNGKELSNTWLTVGASSRYNDKLKASFSNYGKQQIDIFGPGLEIYSTVPGGKYDWAQGTSMASPAVAGVAALVWSYYPRLSASQLRNILIESGNENEQLLDISKQGKVVDALNAMKMAESIVNK